MTEKTDKTQEITFLSDRYRLVIQARNFHYDNFSKWMTFFYIAIGAIFLGYCSIIMKENKPDTSFIEITILILGFLTSLFWYWSSKGYYYWAINFITLVNNYESKILEWEKDERVYGVFANKKTNNNISHPMKGANISTSKIAILFSYTICLAWGIVLANEINSTFFKVSPTLPWVVIYISTSIFLIWFLSKLSQKHIESYIDHLPDLKIEQLPIRQNKS